MTGDDAQIDAHAGCRLLREVVEAWRGLMVPDRVAVLAVVRRSVVARREGVADAG